MKKVKVEILERNAIYVDEIRITDRSTKWGIRYTLCEFKCPIDHVVDECLKRGFTDHVARIDSEPYVSQRS